MHPLTSLALRYTLLILLGLGNLWIFYTLFTPLTIYLTTILLQSSITNQNTLLFHHLNIKLIPACIAGAAYYALTVLNLTTPMPPKKRLSSLLFLLTSFFLINLLRIILFAHLSLTNTSYFNALHQLTWHLGSTAAVAALWLANTAIFKIKAIPIYTDVRTIARVINQKDQKRA